MRPFIPVLLAAVVLSLPGNAAIAGPIMLASFDETYGYSVAPVADPLVRFRLSLFSLDPEAAAILSPPTLWADGDSGSIDMRRGSIAFFDQFASMATDGIDTQYTSGAGFINAIGRANVGPESELFGVSPDLVGYELELIRLIVHSIHTAPFQVDGLDGFELDYDITYEFYGTPIPEPATVVLMATGLLAFGIRRARRVLFGTN